MTLEMWIAVAGGLWGLLTALMAPVVAFTTPGYLKWNAGPRDTEFALPPMYGRFKRAYANFLESYIPFAVIVVALTIVHGSSLVSQCGAVIYLVARVVYVPLYAYGVSGWRSMAWAVALAGVVACLFALIQGTLP